VDRVEHHHINRCHGERPVLERARAVVGIAGINWWFTSGNPIVTLWTPATGAREFQCEPTDLVVLVRGMAHTLHPDHPLVHHQFSSVPRPGVREGHIPVAILQRERSSALE
jgi:hypothetical protein